MKKTFLQIFLQTMCLMALISLPWVSKAQSFSYSCDFENDDDPASWVFVNSPQGNQWCINTAAHNGDGTKGLYISDDNGASCHYNSGTATCVYAYHTMTALGIGNYNFSYDWCSNGESMWGNKYDFLRVFLVPDSITFTAGNSSGISSGILPSGWLPLDGGSGLCDSISWSTKSGHVFVPTAGDYKLVFYWRNDASGGTEMPAAIDNISFVLPSCPSPVNIEFSNIFDDQVTISWTATGAASAWIVECVPSGTEPGTGASIIESTTETSITISGLANNISYDVYVKSDCTTEQSEATMASFQSACGIITLPYHYNFEDTDPGEFPACWTKVNNKTAKIVTKASRTLGIAAGAIVATPYVPIAGNQIELEFMLERDGNGSGAIQIGFVNDLADVADMTIVSTISPTTNRVNTLCDADFSVMGADVTQPGYIIFKQIDYASDYWYYWIDDVEIRQLSDCRRPVSMSASRITHTAATLSWTHVDGATSYEVVYGTINDPDTSDNIFVSGIINDSTNLADLASDTKYYMWVRNNCGSEVSDWRFGGSFRTQVSCASLTNVEITSATTHGVALAWDYNTSVGLPATEVEVAYRIDGTDDDYIIANTSNNYFMISGLSDNTTYEYRLRTICDADTASAVTGTFKTLACGTTIAGGTSVTNYFPTYVYDNFAYTQMLYTANELAGIDTINGISFRYASGNGSITRTLDVYLGHTSISTLSGTSPVPISSLTLVGSDVQLNINEGWCSIDFDSSFAYDGTSNLVIAIDDNTDDWKTRQNAYYHDGGVSLYYTSAWTDIDPTTVTDMDELAGVPDITFCTPCPPLSCSAPLLSLGEVSATEINLVWAAGGSDNQWVVEYKSRADDVWTLSETTTNTTATINNLQPGTYYNIRVGSICTSDTLYSSLGTYTVCGTVSAPFSENFNSSELNPCLTFGNVDPLQLGPNLSSDALYFYRLNGYVILPEFTNDINSLRIAYQIKCSNTGRIMIAVGTDKNDWTTFTPIDTVSNTSLTDYEPQMTYLNSYTGQGHYIAICALTPYMFVDDIVVENIPDCAMPTDVAASHITDSSAQISWNGNNGSSDGWVISYTNLDTDENLKVSTSETSYILSGLANNTEYQVLVSNLCNGDTINAIRPIYFRTNCGVKALPFVEDFENEPTYEFPLCWSNIGGQTQVMSSSSYTTDGYKVLSIDNNAIAISPKLSLQGYPITIEFLLKRADADAGKLIVGFTTNNLSMDDMVVIDTIIPTSDVCLPYQLDFDNTTAANEGYIVWKQIDIVTDYTYETQYYLDLVNIHFSSNCGKPSSFVATQIQSNQATLSWNGSINATSYEVVYGTASNVDATTHTSQMATTESITISNLLGSTTYYAWVRTLCAQDTSDWSSRIEFTTPCDAIALPFSEDFSTIGNMNALHCWTEYEGLLSNVLAGTESLVAGSSSWAINHRYQVNSGQSNAKLNICGSYTKSWLATPPIYIDSVANFECDIARHNNNNTIDTDDKFHILITSDNGTTWHTLQSWEGQSIDSIPSYSSRALHVNINLAAYVDSNINIAFYGESTASGADYDILVDNIAIQLATAPVCDAPTNLAVSNITETAADLSWNGTATAYDVEYKVQNTEAWTTVSATENTYNLTALQPATAYDWRVRANCGEHTSDWVISTFTTLEESASVCPIPTNLSVEADYGEAVLTWECEGEVSQWVVRLSDGETTQFDTVTTQPYTMTELYSATEYHVAIKSICSATSESEWSEELTFTTKSCPAITNVMATFISTNSAMIIWQCPEASKWEVMYGEEVNLENDNSEITTEPRYELENLEPETHYEFYVRSVCGITAFGEWSNYSFTTEAEEDPESIDGIEGNYQLTIYPNPTTDATTISLTGIEGKVEISVVDMNGRTVTSESIECAQDCEKRLDVTNLAQGTYFVRVLGDDINSVRKLIVR